MEKAIEEGEIQGVVDLYLVKDFKELSILYEPVWALGTGQTPRPEEVEEVVKIIYKALQNLYQLDKQKKIRIVYAGSVTPSNVEKYIKIPGINGVAVGTASLQAEIMAEIIHKVENVVKRQTF